MRFIATYVLLATASAFAAGDGGHGSAADLIAPAVNVAILVGFLVWKLKKPLNDSFTKKAEEIADQSEADVKTFEKNIAKETEDKIHKLKTDATSKISADKKAIMDELNADLLNQVIAKTKSTIKTNKDFQSKASNKLLQGLK